MDPGLQPGSDFSSIPTVSPLSLFCLHLSTFFSQFLVSEFHSDVEAKRRNRDNWSNVDRVGNLTSTFFTVPHFTLCGDDNVMMFVLGLLYTSASYRIIPSRWVIAALMHSSHLANNGYVLIWAYHRPRIVDFAEPDSEHDIHTRSDRSHNPILFA